MRHVLESELPTELLPHPENDSISTYADKLAEYAQAIADNETLYENEAFAELAATFRIIAAWGRNNEHRD